MTRDEELAKAREAMNNAPVQPPRPYTEPTDIPQAPMPVAPAVQNKNNSLSGVEAMTAADFLSVGNAPKYIDKFWESKNKKVQIKKFKKGDLDKISAPLLSKTMKLDLSSAASGMKQQEMNLDLNMDIFNEMEKIMVELGMSAYKDNRGQPIITRSYIDNEMDEDDFKELAALIKEVNPKALLGNVDAGLDVDATKK